MTEKKNYKDTLNLPKTSFPMKANLPRREPEILKNWEEEGLRHKIKLKAKKGSKYILHDGPPYANGHIHIGHALNKILKDIIVKYKTMRGQNAEYVPGWDCHGLPIEHQLFKELKITKHEIDQVKFRKKARAYAEKFVNIQRDEFKRLGIFGDWESPYLTMDYSYQASIIKAFAGLYLDGYIYRGMKPIHWCSKCETALAEAELEYANKVSTSVFVKFNVDLKASFDAKAVKKLKEIAKDGKVSVLIWTTTPWTLPANVAIAFHPDFYYSVADTDDGIMVFAQPLLVEIKEKLGLKKCEVIDKLKGNEFEGLECKHPFIERNSKAVLADYVSETEGSGCVHIAPGHGVEDYEVGLIYNLPVLSPVDERGCFTAEFPFAKGKNVFKANGEIVRLLKDKGSLKYEEGMEHSYPHCWRCKSPVIFRATNQWFLNVDHSDLRSRVIDVVADSSKSKWIPEWGKNRILGMLESRPDWCLSRQRYWGVGIPVFYCKSCGETVFSKVIAQKLESVVTENGDDVWFDWEAEKLLPENTKCGKCGSDKFDKEKDIIDVWFDSGVSHQAVLKSKEELSYPCDLYLEGSDQHRGWFQTSLITSVAIDNLSPFKSVLTHGFVVDGEGKKMSKSRGNVVSPQEVMKKFGADVLRLWVSSCDYVVDIRLSNEILDRMVEAYRRIRNTFRYILGNLNDFDPKENKISFDELDDIDSWALGSCMKLVRKVEECYDAFKFHQIYRLVHDFCTTNMSSFYLDVLKDRLYTAGKDSKKRRSSQTALYYVLRNLVKILAPVLPFTCDEVWKTFPLQSKTESVHVAEWPGDYPELVHEQLIAEWNDLIQVRELVNGKIEEKREEKVIGSSLEAKVKIFAKEEKALNLLKKYGSDLPMVFIASQVEVEKLGGDKESMETSSVEFMSDENFYNFHVIVGKAEGEKCDRCWNYSTTVGNDTEDPGICAKCIEVIRKGS